MSKEDSRGEQQDPSIRDVPGELCTLMSDEWNRRTRWGKLVYPLWLLGSAIHWVSFFSFMGLLIGAFRLADLFRGSVGDTDSIPPKVYKDE